MLGDTATVEVVADWLPAVPDAVVVLDPVMVATSGHRLLDADAEKAVRELVPHADLVTPNLPELAVLLDVPVADDWADALEQARELSRRTGAVVLAKGGHLTSGPLPGRARRRARPGARRRRRAARRTRGHPAHPRHRLLDVVGDGHPAGPHRRLGRIRSGRSRRGCTTASSTPTSSRSGPARGPIHHFHAMWTASDARRWP